MRAQGRQDPAGPIEQIGHIYKNYGIEWTAEAKSAMRAWYDSPLNKGDRHGKFTYSLESFGVRKEQIEEDTRAYRERFSIPQERG